MLDEELLLNTDSFCVAAGRAAREDPDGGWAVRAERERRCTRPRARHSDVEVGLL
ncbi:hypothetical protein GCM10020295_24590 [Streptomyces cinereospinus]